MDLAQYYIAWKELMKAGEALPFWQEAFVKFYQAFIDGNRWQQYLEGVGVTIAVTAMALLLGVVLGIVVAVIRTAHDQQRIGQRNVLLGIVNAVCKCQPLLDSLKFRAVRFQLHSGFSSLQIIGHIFLGSRIITAVFFYHSVKCDHIVLYHNVPGIYILICK